MLDAAHSERIDSLEAKLDGYWQTFEPLFDWTRDREDFSQRGFLRQEVVPRREAILAIAQEIEELNNANAGRAARRSHASPVRISRRLCTACCGKPCCSASASR